MEEVSVEASKKFVKRLAYGVFTISVLMMLLGSAFFVSVVTFEGAPDPWDLLFLSPGLIAAIGAVSFVLAMFLLKKHSYSAAVILTILTALETVLVLTIAASIFPRLVSGDTPFGVWFFWFSWISVNFFFVWACFRGVKATQNVEKKEKENISPDIFS